MIHRNQKKVDDGNTIAKLRISNMILSLCRGGKVALFKVLFIFSYLTNQQKINLKILLN